MSSGWRGNYLFHCFCFGYSGRLPVVVERFGGPALAKVLMNQYAQPAMGARILEIGCGPGNNVGYLPPSEYLGFHLSPKYIEQAKKRFESTFVCGTSESILTRQREKFDLVLALGIVHHLTMQKPGNYFKFA